MFDPKSNNLLDDQLAVSGLEMNIAGIFAGVSAVASIAGGIFGASQASKQNSANRKANKDQRKFAKETAKLTNEHNALLDAADQANYYAMRDYSYRTSIINWNKGRQIQDFDYANRLMQYQKSQAIGNAQLGLNARAASLGIEAEQNAVKEAFIQMNFQHQQNLSSLKQAYVEGNLAKKEAGVQLMGIKSRQKLGQQSVQNTIDQLMSQNALQQETAMVESLAAEGTAQLGQAGKSKAKRQQANKAALHRSLMALESELSGRYKQAAIQLAELNAESSLAEIGVGINLERIDNAIQNAEEDADFNLEVMSANMNSQIRTAEQNIKQISIEREIADLNTKAAMMLPPIRMPYDPMPEAPPERIFVDRMEAIPGFVPPPQQQSVWAPLISGIGSAAGSLMQV